MHNETSTGVTSRIGAVRAALDAAGHPALLLVDTISSLASIDYRHDEWGVDVTVGGSQKGLMLPPGLGFNAVSNKALAASKVGRDGTLVLGLGVDAGPERDRILPLHSGDEPALRPRRGHRHAARGRSRERVPAPRPSRRGDAARSARVGARGVVPPAPDEYSSSLTAVRVPEGHSADALRRTILETFDMSLGNGLGRLADSVFRIGHLGDFNDLMLAGTLSGIEMGLHLAGVPHGAAASPRHLRP